MSHPTDEPLDPTLASPSGHPEEPADHPAPQPDGIDVDEQAPDGGPAEPARPARARKAAAREKVADAREAEPAAESEPEAEAEAEPPAPAEDDEPAPELVWYVLKVQSSREDTIADALKRRVKIQGLERFFGKIVVPTEKITEIRNNKKRVVERKTYPGYIMVQMELNEKTWFLVRETPGVGDFVGAHGTPTKMTDVEVNQMLHQEEQKTTAEAPKMRIDVERGDRVKIKDGPFENFEGTVEEVIEGRGLVKVMLIIFNRPTPVDLEYWQLERI
jgi:transcriptional antiterminator NusG